MMKPLTISHISEDNDQLIFDNNLHFDCDYLQDLADKFQPSEKLFETSQADIFIILTTMAKDTNENWHYISYTATFEANIGATHIDSKKIWRITSRPRLSRNLPTVRSSFLHSWYQRLLCSTNQKWLGNSWSQQRPRRASRR